MPTLLSRLAAIWGNKFGRLIHISRKKIVPIVVTHFRKGFQTVNGYKEQFGISTQFEDVSECFSYKEMVKTKVASEYRRFVFTSNSLTG